MIYSELTSLKLAVMIISIYGPDIALGWTMLRCVMQILNITLNSQELQFNKQTSIVLWKQLSCETYTKEQVCWHYCHASYTYR